MSTMTRSSELEQQLTRLQSSLTLRQNDLAEVDREIRAANRLVTESAVTIRRLQTLLSVYRWMLRFRSFRNEFELWPYAVLIVGPFLAGAIGLVLSMMLRLQTVGSVVFAMFGAILGATVSSIAVAFPSTERINRSVLTHEERLMNTTSESVKYNDTLRSLNSRRAEFFALEQNVKNKLEAVRAQLEYQRKIESAEYQRQQHFRKNWKAMRSIEFEDYLAEAFKLLGYEVETTKTSGDQGVDLVVADGNRRIAIQVKGYISSVGNAAVQEAYAGMAFYRCTACAVITNSRFTSSAVELADSVNCQLISEDEMRDLILGTIRL